MANFHPIYWVSGFFRKGIIPPKISQTKPGFQPDVESRVRRGRVARPLGDGHVLEPKVAIAVLDGGEALGNQGPDL